MTRARIWFGYAPRREDILDLALADYSREEILRRTEKICADIEATWEALPPFLAATRNDTVDIARLKPLDAIEQLQVRLGQRANELLLQRVLMRKAGAGPREAHRAGPSPRCGRCCWWCSATTSRACSRSTSA